MRKFLGKFCRRHQRQLKALLGAVIVYLFLLLVYNLAQVPRTTTPPTPKLTYKNELTPATATESLPDRHIVAASESLWSIAEKYYNSGYNWVDIARTNNLVNPDELAPGTQLTIPKVEDKTPTMGTLQPTVTVQKITGDTYTVVRGDTLWDIALRAYGDPYRWTDLASANRLTNPDLIFSGHVLKIPR